MRGKRLVMTVCSIVAVAVWSTAGWAAPEADPLKPRVPDAERADVRKMKSPITVTPEIIAKGKELYEGKGTCINCHGMTGGRWPGGDACCRRALETSRTASSTRSGTTENSTGSSRTRKSTAPGCRPDKGGVITEEEAWMTIAYERNLL